jgi:hypothetical protein
VKIGANGPDARITVSIGAAYAAEVASIKPRR